uniref:Uncharacterized protein n=1 Tax=Avena sativa TaxID=4498 RepID=A0ACD5X411_AVESA
MTRQRRPGRRAARREDEALRGKRVAAAPVPPHYGDVERRLAEEVLYLHSLWRSGPPTPAPHPGGGSVATHVRADRRKRRRLERLAEPQDAAPDWPLAPSPPVSPSPAPWPDASSSSPAKPPPQPSPASLAQRPALRAAEEFFSGHASDDEDDDEEGSESEDAGDAAAGFFVELFERDAALRGYYERSYEEGEFLCMGCVGKARRGRARRFRDCISLVQHARAATRCGRRRAHRALASTVCRVLGWDIERLPSIVIDPRGTLGQALLAREAKENANGRENGDEDAAKEDVDSGKNSSSSHEGVTMLQEDVGSEMNDGSLSGGGVAAKDNVGAGKSGPSSNDNDGEVHEQENVSGSAEKEDTNVIDPLSSKDTPKELSDAEEAASENKEHTNNIVGTGDDGIGNPENNLMDSSKVHSCTHDIWTSRMEILD